MDKQAIDKTAGELFSDSKTYVILALYCCVFAIVKAVRSVYTGIHTSIVTSVWSACDCVSGTYNRYQKEVFICWSTLGWGFSMSLVALHLYST